MEEVSRRLRNARGELEALRDFDYVVVNEDLEAAVRQVREIVRAEGHRPVRAVDLEKNLVGVRTSIDRILETRFTLEDTHTNDQGGTA